MSWYQRNPKKIARPIRVTAPAMDISIIELRTYLLFWESYFVRINRWIWPWNSAKLNRQAWQAERRLSYLTVSSKLKPDEKKSWGGRKRDLHNFNFSSNGSFSFFGILHPANIIMAEAIRERKLAWSSLSSRLKAASVILTELSFATFSHMASRH